MGHSIRRHPERSYKYSMNVQDCIESIEKLLRQNNRNFEDSHAQLLYERGYLTGILAQMMMEDPRIRHNIIERVKHKK